MSGKKAVENLIKRMYRQYEKTRGRLPDDKSTREMARKAIRTAETVEKKRAGR